MITPTTPKRAASTPPAGEISPLLAAAFPLLVVVAAPAPVTVGPVVVSVGAAVITPVAVACPLAVVGWLPPPPPVQYLELRLLARDMSTVLLGQYFIKHLHFGP